MINFGHEILKVMKEMAFMKMPFRKSALVF